MPTPIRYSQAINLDNFNLIIVLFSTSEMIAIEAENMNIIIDSISKPGTEY